MKQYINPTFLNTSDAYSDNFLVGKQGILVPFINMHLMSRNPINNVPSFVDFSYYIFKEPSLIMINGNLSIKILDTNLEKCNSEYIYIHAIGGLEIFSKASYFILMDSSKISTNFCDFIPHDTPNFPKTLDTQQVDDFNKNKNLLEEILRLIR